MLIAETGQPMQLRSPAHPDPVPPRGLVPAYLAFPLHGGEHIPSGTPALSTKAQAGRGSVGPLDLDPLVRAQLNAALDASGMAIVHAAHRNYAVEYLPRYARLHAHSGSPASAPTTTTSGNNAASSPTTPTQAGGGSSTPTATATSSPTPSATPTAGPTPAATATSSPASTPQLSPTIDGIPASELEQWLALGSNKLIHWTSLGVNDLASSLGLGGSKSTSTKPALTPEAQELMPPGSSAGPLPAPIPEPGTWLVFGLILGAAGLKQGLGRRIRGGA
jgi:hypothetical protein